MYFQHRLQQAAIAAATLPVVKWLVETLASFASGHMIYACFCFGFKIVETLKATSLSVCTLQ